MAIPEKRWLALLDWQRLHLAVAAWPPCGTQDKAQGDATAVAGRVFDAAVAGLTGRSGSAPDLKNGLKRTLYVQTG